mmetsp:Transcript_24767/g.56037  ORF Transcript_24767/g.56037 Transcript_24767/m.56037 type:complete len:326 (+) Transcript_24767:284-1261(+)
MAPMARGGGGPSCPPRAPRRPRDSRRWAARGSDGRRPRPAPGDSTCPAASRRSRRGGEAPSSPRGGAGPRRARRRRGSRGGGVRAAPARPRWPRARRRRGRRGGPPAWPSCDGPRPTPSCTAARRTCPAVRRRGSRCGVSAAGPPSAEGSHGRRRRRGDEGVRSPARKEATSPAKPGGRGRAAGGGAVSSSPSKGEGGGSVYPADARRGPILPRGASLESREGPPGLSPAAPRAHPAASPFSPRRVPPRGPPRRASTGAERHMTGASVWIERGKVRGSTALPHLPGPRRAQGLSSGCHGLACDAAEDARRSSSGGTAPRRTWGEG